jgi:ppGpp synthetase/RelA/SpoT-type nucleotidyltranferase
MSIVEEFLEHYNREIDHFSAVARAVRTRLKIALDAHGVRAIVTSRAKDVRGLRDKVVKRNALKNYSSVKLIYEDLIDLAGVRVALYFPAERDKVAAIIEELFQQVRKSKKFPEPKKRAGKRFWGYVATHYLVRLKPEDDSQNDNRYVGTNVEVQVASVLMHAWAEVEHDLEYKPESGEISEEESSILDEVNGLVLTGELALERLQKAIQRRVGKEGAEFHNQFELASYLSQRAQKEGMDEKDVGRVDALLIGLQLLKLATPTKLQGLFGGFTDDERSRPLADVLIDRLIARTGKRDGQKLVDALSPVLADKYSSGGRTEALGSFLAEWQRIENLVRRLVRGQPGASTLPFISVMRSAKLPEELTTRLNDARILRNHSVHDVQSISTPTLREATLHIQFELIPELRAILAKRRDQT